MKAIKPISDISLKVVNDILFGERYPIQIYKQNLLAAEFSQDKLKGKSKISDIEAKCVSSVQLWRQFFGPETEMES